MTFFKVETEGHVQTWTMSNPPMNYMTAAMSQELTELVGAPRPTKTFARLF